MKEECLDRMIPLWARHFRRAIMEVVEHYNDVSYCLTSLFG
jgi:hypothetical protein